MLGDGFAIGTAIADNSSILFWGLIVFNVIVFAIVLTDNREYFKTLFSTLIFNRYLVYNSQEILKTEHFRSRLLTLTYFTTLGACALRFVDGAENGIIIGVLVLLGASLIKFGCMWILGFVSKTKEGLLEHHLNHHVFFQTSSLILTILLIFSYSIGQEYSIVIVWIIGIVILLGLLIREIQSLIRALSAKVSILYIILYLCTLEIVPFLVILRVFTSSSAVLS